MPAAPRARQGADDGGGAVESLAGRPLLLCLSHLRWDFVFQRPQHLLTRAALGADVVFFEEPEYAEGITARLDRSVRPGGVIVAVPHLPWGLDEDGVNAALTELLDAELARHDPEQRLVAWFYTPMALAYAGHLKPDVTVYDVMDELSAFRGASPRMLGYEAELLGRADLVFTGGRSLYEAKRDRHPRVSFFPSSIDAAHYAVARAPVADPADQAGIPHPRIGFFGVVDERMDVELVGRLAALRPGWQFVMIGPVVKIEADSLPRAANIHWLGGKPYAELPRYLGGWDLGFMPFALNESTRFISPTKTPEFLAAGLPVVSTPVVDVVRDYGEAGLVEIATTDAEFVAKLDALLTRPRGPWLAQVDERLAKQSWDATWDGMHTQIEQALVRRASTERGRRRVGIANPRTQETVHV